MKEEQNIPKCTLLVLIASRFIWKASKNKPQIAMIWGV